LQRRFGAVARFNPQSAGNIFSRMLSNPCGVARRRDEAPPLPIPTFTLGDAMNKQVIFNLPVKDLERSQAFFAALGFTVNPRFSGREAVFMDIIEGHKQANEVVICLSCESRKEVDSLIAKAVAAGARIPHPPEDHGFMYDQGFEDLDGHLWNLVWTAPQA
jgi:predicted lactoylglutathione lyase